MNKYEEVETIATYQTIGNKLQNDLTATYITPIVRFFIILILLISVNF